MKRALTILTAALFASALALPAMAQTSDSNANKEAPAASAVTNPAMTGSETAKPSADENAAKADNGEMKQEQKPAADSSQPKSESSTSEAGSNAATTNPGHSVE